MNCQRPLAPARETATGLNPLSIMAVNMRSSGSPLLRRTPWIISAYRPERPSQRSTRARRYPVWYSSRKRRTSALSRMSRVGGAVWGPGSLNDQARGSSEEYRLAPRPGWIGSGTWDCKALSAAEAKEIGGGLEEFYHGQTNGVNTA